MADTSPIWDNASGTAGGAHFGSALQEAAQAQGVDTAALARAAEIDDAMLRAVFEGNARLTISALARLARELRLRPIEFLQKLGFLSLEVYAAGLDPLYFLPEGPIRYDARIYMREINPRHAVPEADMTRRNPTLSALGADSLLDDLGKLEIELAYLLRAATQQMGGTL
ncbi:MAG: hypothetical protein JO024_08600 [Candidatus Eremiobacteraeota bacterium]|nr:hypothetical protein [Candidatus Eremiobacteraeota bacterium]MBV9737915.1 hypothetical protein [Candidatus Eremiobacteraeota bacterium]